MLSELDGCLTAICLAPCAIPPGGLDQNGRDGQDRAQRALPLRLGQEVQALLRRELIALSPA